MAGTGIGIFTGSITGLASDTTYYARAYATNSSGTGYGSQVEFKTEKASPAVIYVKQNVTGIGSGTSWADAYPDLQTALEKAKTGDQIWVAVGTYNPSSLLDADDPRTATFSIKNNVRLLGGFSGTETDPGQRDLKNNITILSGDIGVAGDISDNCYHVVYSYMTDSSAVLEGFKIAGGNADNVLYPDGGGMYNESGSPLITKCIFEYNTAINGGGGIFNISGGSLIEGCIFRFNTSLYGAGMYNNSSHIKMTGCTFDNNTASSYGFGGGIKNTDGSADIINCTFSANKADFGGGIYTESSILNITNSTVVSNIADNDGDGNGFGGGIFGSGGSIYFRNTIIADNLKNTAGSITPDDCLNAPHNNADIVSEGYNLVEYSEGYVFNATGDITGEQSALNIGALADNGGSTQTLRLTARQYCH